MRGLGILLYGFWVLAVLGLVGCAAPPPPRPAIPEDLIVCPGPTVVPPAPKGLRTPESIARYATRLDESLVRSERARAACASQLLRLNAWLLDNR
jgi:hypothetical protein